MNTDDKTLPFQILLAGRTIEIRPLYDEIRFFCRDYILQDHAEESEIDIAVSEAEISREAEAVRQEDEKAGLLLTHSPAFLENFAIHRKIVSTLAGFDTVMVHSSVVSTGGEGYMITAPSGTGKSTRTKLWVDHIPDSFVVNGDKPLLRVTDNAIYVYGTPWCGKEGWNTNTSVPLKAIFLLERSNSGNRVEEIGFAEAFPQLLRQTYRPDDIQAKRKTLQLLQKMAGKVKIYRFRSEPTAEAVQLAWETAREKT